MALTAGQTVAGYEIRGLLGAGGMGEVYRARDARLRRDVALKVLPEPLADDAQRLRRFEREAQVLAALNHPNIAAIYELAEADGMQLLVLELVEGTALDERLHHGPVSVDEVLPVAGQIASALEAAHERGIVHRDLKPANVMLGPKGVAKVLDFGLAKAPHLGGPIGSGEAPLAIDADLGDEERRLLEARLTATGATMGTPPYMSPEQVRGLPLDQRTDIWSFGCLVYELLTGERPFERPSVIQTAGAILQREPDWERLPADTPPALVKLLQRCLQKDPGERLQHIAEARAELDELLREKSAASSLLKGLLGVTAAALAAVLLYFGTRADTGALERIDSVLALPATVTPGNPGESALFAAPVDPATLAYLSDAVPGSLSARLAGLEGLETRRPLSRVQYESVAGDLARLADVYRVDAFLASTLRAVGDQLALELELIDAVTREPLWREELSGTRQDYLGLIHASADELREVLRPSASFARGRELTADSAAELAYREGLHHANRYEAHRAQADFDRAEASFGRALQADPELADAAAALALLHAWSLPQGTLVPEIVERIEHWGRRALEIDPDCGLAWSLLAGIDTWYRWDKPREERLAYLLRAACLAPSSPRPHTSLGMALSELSLGLGAEGFRRSTYVDPLFAVARMNLIGLLLSVGRTEEALAIVEDAERVDLARPLVLISKGLTLAMLGRADEAEIVLEELESMVATGHVAPVMLFELRLEVALAKEDFIAAEDLARSMQDAVASPGTPPVVAFNFVIAACSAFAVSGLVDEAFEILAAGERRGVLLPYDYLVLNARLASLRADPRFARAVALPRERFRTMIAVLEEARRRGEMPTYLERPLAEVREQVRKAESAGG